MSRESCYLSNIKPGWLPRVSNKNEKLTANPSLSTFRNHTNLQNSNYYHLGPRNGNGNYHMMENPYNTTLSVPIAQSLQGGYNNARVSSSVQQHS